MMTIMNIKGHEFKIQNTGSIVRVTCVEIGEICENHFPSQYFATPSKFVGEIIAAYLQALGY